MQDNIFYIHTTNTIINYVTALSKRYLPEKRIFHILDESILFDIQNGDNDSARRKLEQAIRGGRHSGASQFMVTCTSTGQLIDNMDATLKPFVTRIEDPVIVEIKRLSGKTGIVYTNPTVWPEMRAILTKAGVADDGYAACFIDGAFESILAGDTAKHDTLINDYLRKHADFFDFFMLAQVSICSTKDRLGSFKTDAKILSMAELGIRNIKSISPI